LTGPFWGKSPPKESQKLEEKKSRKQLGILGLLKQGGGGKGLHSNNPTKNFMGPASSCLFKQLNKGKTWKKKLRRYNGECAHTRVNQMVKKKKKVGPGEILLQSRGLEDGNATQMGVTQKKR